MQLSGYVARCCCIPNSALSTVHAAGMYVGICALCHWVKFFTCCSCAHRSQHHTEPNMPAPSNVAPPFSPQNWAPSVDAQGEFCPVATLSPSTAAGNCGKGPNMVLMPGEVRLRHVSTPADMMGILQGMNVDIAPNVLQATEVGVARIPA